MPLLAIAEDEEVPGHKLSYSGWLRKAQLFSDLSERDVSRFLDAAQSRTYTKGKVLFVEEEPAAFFYVICSGWVKLFHSLNDGSEVIVDILTEGNLVGESSLFEKDLHTSSAQIVENVQLLSIPSRLLKEQIGLCPALALSMLSSLSRHHRRHYGEMALGSMQNAPQRVGSFLLRLCSDDKAERIAFHLPYDKTLIAETLGIDGATFSRALTILKLKTGLRIKGTSVEIDSTERLIQFVHGCSTSECPHKKYNADAPD